MNEKSMKRWMAVLAVAVSLLSAGSSIAASIDHITAKSGNWMAPDTWVVGTAPAATDNVYVRSGYTVTVTSTVPGAAVVGTGYTSSTGTLNIASGGSLTSSSTFGVGRAALDSVGYLNVYSGGTAAAQTYFAVGMNTGTQPTTGHMSIYGGATVLGAIIVGSTNVTDTGDTLKIIGSGSTIAGTSTSGTGLDFRSGAVSFIFDSTGISTMTYSNVVKDTANCAWIIDGAAYTGGSNTFTLIKCTDLRARLGSLTLTNFAAGTTAKWDTAADAITVTTAIPEPVTIGMVGLGAAALMLYRRSLRK